MQQSFRVIAVTFLALLATLSQPRPAAGQAADWSVPFTGAERLTTSRIIGGSVAPGGSFPMAVQLAFVGSGGPSGRSEDFYCGASVIAPHWLLTAAHCVVPPGAEGSGRAFAASRIAARGGTVARGGGGTLIAAKQIIPHEGYKSTPYGTTNDVALIELAEPMDIPAAQLVSAAMAPRLLAPGHRNATVVGWGVTSFGSNKASDKLLQVDVDLIDHAICAKDNPEFGSDGMRFCAGAVDSCPADGQCPDSCQGDSGGPLFIHTPLGLMQAGVVSFGFECGRVGHPGVYSSVAYFEPWIRQHVPEANFTGRPPPPVFTNTDTALAPTAPPPQPERPSLKPSVSLSLPGGTSLAVGAPLSLRLLSNVPGRLLLFNQNAAGTGYLVVPNSVGRRQGRAREAVAAGRPLLVPDPLLDGFALKASPPTGANRLIAVVVPSDAPGVDALVDQHLANTEIADVGAWVKALAAKLTPGRVATGEISYEIRQ